jgi:hypothetical protein
VANVTVGVGGAQDTGIPPGSVDVVMIRHVLAHNGSREAAIVADATTIVRPGGYVYLADVEMTGLRTRPADPTLADLDARYREWHARRGNDVSVGLRLGELLTTAGLEAVEHHGRFQIIVGPPGFRTPAWAARDALVGDGLANSDDVGRWASAFDAMDLLDPRPTVFAPLFFAFGRRPA